MSIDDLVLAHREYVRKLARQIHRKLPDHAEFEDLVSFGEVGLVEAAGNYDPTSGVAFTTFAYYRIRGAIFDGIAKMTWIPPAYRRAMAREEATDSVAQQAPEIDVTTDPEAAAAQFNETIEKMGAVFLVSGMSEESGVPEPVDESDPTEGAEFDEFSDALHEALTDLDEQDAELVRLHYYEGVSMTDIAKKFGVNKSTIARRHSRIIGALAKALEAA